MNMKLLSPLLLLSLFGITALQAPLSAASNSAAGTNQPYQLQVLKDCKILQSRPLNHAEQTAYLMLQQSQQKMDGLQQPLEAMHQQLDALSEQMEQLNKADDGTEPDYQKMGELGNQMSAVTAQFEPDMAALENHAAIVEQDAKRFEQLIKQNLTGQTFDQLRVLAPGETIAAGDCRRGLFYQASISRDI